MDDLRQKFESILAPAIDARAPYAKVMLDKLAATAGDIIARQAAVIRVYEDFEEPESVWLKKTDAGTDNECWIICAKGDPGAVLFNPAG